MSIVENLLRLHRWELDERRRYLAELESLVERLRADTLRLVTDIGLDVDAPVASPHDSPGKHAYQQLIERRKRLEHSVTEIESQIVAARSAVAEAENEVAHYELAATQRPTPGSAPMGRSDRRLRERVPYRLRRHGS